VPRLDAAARRRSLLGHRRADALRHLRRAGRLARARGGSCGVAARCATSASAPSPGSAALGDLPPADARPPVDLTHHPCAVDLDLSAVRPCFSCWGLRPRRWEHAARRVAPRARGAGRRARGRRPWRLAPMDDWRERLAARCAGARRASGVHGVGRGRC
jgi:hypothetical protein